VFLVVSFCFANFSLARSGCCSHHGGVCGCGCCDGKSLSATCAPYYPNCSSHSTKNTESSDDDWISWVIIVGILAIFGYSVIKK